MWNIYGIKPHEVSAVLIETFIDKCMTNVSQKLCSWFHSCMFPLFHFRHGSRPRTWAGLLDIRTSATDRSFTETQLYCTKYVPTVFALFDKQKIAFKSVCLMPDCSSSQGKPVGTPDPGAYFRLLQDHSIAAMFIAPTALRAVHGAVSSCHATFRPFSFCIVPASNDHVVLFSGPRCEIWVKVLSSQVSICDVSWQSVPVAVEDDQHTSCFLQLPVPVRRWGTL